MLFWPIGSYAHRPGFNISPTEQERKEIRSSITLVCISDTHNTTPTPLPDGDVLLHAGDLTSKGTIAELQAQLDWINTFPHAHKVVIGGNHDSTLDAEFMAENPWRFKSNDMDSSQNIRWGNIVYLNDTSTTLSVRGRSITIYGSPITPQCGTFAFQYLPIRDVWKNRIPDRTDIVLTHGPPKGHLDLGDKGCEWLLRELWRVKPRAVVFGHIHRGRGKEAVTWDASQAAHDFPSFLRVLVAVAALAWSWLLFVVSQQTTVVTWFVNAAIGGENDKIQVVTI